jgi:glucose-6-phosphate isomerase
MSVSYLQNFSVIYQDALFDFTNQLISELQWQKLLERARQAGLTKAIQQLQAGEIKNLTEHRQVLHTALRATSGHPNPTMDAHVQDAIKVRKQMRGFVNQLHAGQITGVTGKQIRTVVNIGVGGSNLGSRLVTEALARYKATDIQIFFVANIDAEDLNEVLQQINPEETLFLITSKTFTTFETMQNASAAIKWLEQKLLIDRNQIIAHHFLGITAEPLRAATFGINADYIFRFWDWVGGRFSLWSAVGLPIAILTGMDHFEALLAGAQSMDEHFFTTPLETNIPVMMGLIGLWNIEDNYAAGLSIAPYCHGLRSFPSYLQQLEMESNGKGVDIDGKPIIYRTAQAVFGSVGSNGQHAYFQMLHQGNRQLPTDFIAIAEDTKIFEGHQDQLLANCFAQSAALAHGRFYPNEPHKTCLGGQRSSMIILPKQDPFSIGVLLAAYEHKIFVQAHLWRINAFDQWGVELGKSLAHDILPVLHGKQVEKELDEVTINRIKFVNATRTNYQHN